MIELYLYVKIYLDYFTGRLKNAKFGELTALTFWVPVPKVAEFVSGYLYPLILHRFMKNYLGVYELIEHISRYFKICL